MKRMMLGLIMMLCGTLYAYSDNAIWFVIENQTGHELTYEMQIAANTSDGLRFTNTELNPKTFLHIERSDQDHILLVKLKFIIPKHETIVYYPTFFVEEAIVFPTVYQVNIEVGKRKKIYTFPIHESTCRHMTIGYDIVDELELIRTQIPLHTYLYHSLSYQWQSLLLGLQSVQEEEKEEEA